MATSCSDTFKKLKFELKNKRWSWGAVNEEHKAVMLRVWQHEIVRLKNLNSITPTDLHPNTLCALVYNHSYHVETNTLEENGTTERCQHIELIRQGYKAFGICVASKKDSDGDWTYDIERHYSQTVYVFDHLFEVSTDYPDRQNYYISVLDKTPVNKFKLP